MGKWILAVLVLAGGYWYWSGPYQAGRVDREQRQLLVNDRIMERCIRESAAIVAGEGMAGMAYEAGEEEQICADKHRLYFYQGHWRSSESDTATF